MVGSGRLDGDELTHIVEVHIAKAIEREPERAISGMFFFCIERDHHAAHEGSVAPREPAADEIGSESPVPHDRTWWTFRTRDASETESLSPNALGIGNQPFVKKEFEQRIGVAQLELRVKGGQPRPYSQSLVGFFLCSQG